MGDGGTQAWPAPTRTASSSRPPSVGGDSGRRGGGNDSWNSAHPSRGCSQQNLTGTGGTGYLYCFAVN
jgi:hypothetical protein